MLALVPRSSVHEIGPEVCKDNSPPTRSISSIRLAMIVTRMNGQFVYFIRNDVYVSALNLGLGPTTA